MRAQPSSRLRAGLLLVGIAIVSLVLHLRDYDRVVLDDRLSITDNDTQRRLTRLEHLVDPTLPYPYHDPWDGYPQGSTIHWTLPMDGVILALDAPLAAAYPQARPHEAGAIWAGPVLALAAALAFAALCLRLAPSFAPLASLLYVLSYTPLTISHLGNGDHHTLQHLCAVVFLLGVLVLLAGRGGWMLAVAIGSAVGLGLWVSSEALVSFLMLAAVTLIGLAVARWRGGAVRLQPHIVWVASASAVAFVGDRLEHPDAGLTGWTFEWDTISGFQLLPLAIVLLWLALWWLLDRPARRPWKAIVLAGVLALSVGLAPFVASRSQRTRFSEEVQEARAASTWIRHEVFEYRPLLSIRGFFDVHGARQRFTAAIFLLPLFMFGVLADTRRSAGLRVAAVALAAGLFGLTCYEVKYGHLFAIVYPLLLVLGGAWWLELLFAWTRWSAGRRTAARLCGASLLAACFAVGAPEVRGEPSAAQTAREELWRVVRDLPRHAGDRQAVLARWSFGANLMYHGRRPVVASGYHRNLGGIRDSYRVLTARPDESGDLARILRERRVGWIITESNPDFLLTASEAFPELGRFGRVTGMRSQGDGGMDLSIEWNPAVKRTLYWNLHHTGRVQSARVRGHEIRFLAEIPAGITDRGGVPYFKIYEVRDSD